MQSDPLVPFAPPAFLQTVNVDQVVSVVFALLFILWALYTLITTYHWLRYGHRSSIAIPALITHVVVSGFLSLYAVSGFTG
ncbi:MAG: hypothetical protein Q8S35_01200 [bacterium]|nr:hypothetical protein [bacterium]